MTLEQLPVDAWLVVVALEVAEGAQLDQVRVPLVGLGEEREVRVALRQRTAIVRDVHLAAEDRLDARLSSLAVELDRPRQGAVVGEGDRGHLQPRRLLDERGDPARTVEDRVLGVDVEMDERRRSAHGRAIVLSPGDRTIVDFCHRRDVSQTPSGLDRRLDTSAVPRPRGRLAYGPADSSRMVHTRTERDALRERALVLAAELGLDTSAWYFLVLAESKSAGEPTDLGALVRAYWELQRVTGRADLRDDWRRLADAFWDTDAA